MQRRIAAVALAVTAVLLTTGCASSVLDTPATPTKTASDGVYSKYDKLTGSNRSDALYKAAVQEGGELNIYTPNQLEPAFVDLFNKKYPNIKVNVFVSLPAPLLQRVLQEGQAGKIGADVIDLSDINSLDAMNTAGYLDTYTSPVLKKYPAKITANNSTMISENAYVVAWNSSLLPGSSAPKSFAELADPKWSGKINVALSDWDWYAGMIAYLQKTGKSKSDATKLVDAVVKNSQAIDGKSAQLQALAAGQSEVAVTAYSLMVDRFADQGAKVEWKPLAGPAILQPIVSGLVRNAKHPAASLLWMDFMLGSGAQNLLIAQHRLAVDTHLPSPVPADAKTFAITSMAPADAATWSDRFAALLRK